MSSLYSQEIVASVYDWADIEKGDLILKEWLKQISGKDGLENYLPH